MRVLTNEQLDEVDRIITDTLNIEIDYHYDGESSYPVEDAEGSLREAARRVRAYLASLES